MKRTWIVALTAIFAVGVLLVGCPVEDDGGGEDLKPDYGLNYVDESSILTATGTGITNVTKVSDGVYKVSGKVTDFQPWSENGDAPHDKRITLNIAGTFLAAERYTMTYDFPTDGTVFPKPAYTAGFRVYLENTSNWAGTWQHEYAEEYNNVHGKGKFTINRDITEPAVSNEKGDYHQLVTVLIFPDTAEGQTYEFTISNVGVFTKDYGTNMVTKAAILAAKNDSANTGVIDVTEVSDGVYKVSGKVTDFQPWSENGDAPHDKRIALNIAGIFNAADRYTITCDLPKTGNAFPKPAYTAGFRVYLENTSNWAGTWQHEYAEEYNKVQGKGKVEIDRTLLMPTISNEKGDYHHLVVVLIFPDEAVDKTYEFTISNVGVYTHAVTP